jgi:pimeloyl-ACP methyl ester carboxylesterase
MPFFDFNSYKIYYNDLGNKQDPVITFIPGFTCSSTIYTPQYTYFSQHYRCLSLDLLGHGKSARPNPAVAGDLYNYRGFLECILTLLSHLKVEKTSLVGWSMGSTTAFEFAFRFPEKVESLILIGSSPYYFLVSDDDEFPGIPKSMADHVLEEFRLNFDQFYPQFVKNWFTDEETQGEVPGYVTEALEDCKSVGGEVAYGILRLVGPHDFREDIPQIKTRTLLIQGGKDKATPVAGAQWIYDHLGGEKKFLVYEEAGHSAFLGATSEKFNINVDNFLQSSK